MSTTKRVLEAALDCARDKNYRLMTRADIAAYANVAESMVSHCLGDMNTIRSAVMDLAVRIEDPYVVAQGIFFKDPVVKNASLKLRQEALRTICLEGGADV